MKNAKSSSKKLDLLCKTTISKGKPNILATHFSPIPASAEGTKRKAQLHSEIGRDLAAGFRKINKRKRRTENDQDGNGKAHMGSPKGVGGGS